MKKQFEFLYPEFIPPLEIERKIGRGNRGYGSGMDDYTFITKFYKTEEGEEVFREYDGNYPHSNSRWNVNDRMSEFYEWFGEENFENFIEWYYGIDIKNKFNREHNWLFV